MSDSLYQLAYTDNKGKEVKLEEHADKVMLIVNTASKCGFTPQYKGLEALHEKYKDQGLEIIGFPCDQFGGQEPGSDQDIEQFCELNYGVNFSLSTKVEVNGDNTCLNI
jgi:glutathione peroxidase